MVHVEARANGQSVQLVVRKVQIRVFREVFLGLEKVFMQTLSARYQRCSVAGLQVVLNFGTRVMLKKLYFNLY